MPDPMTTGTFASSFDAPQFFQFGRFAGSRSRDDDAVDEKELCLLDDIGNVEITRQRVRAMLFVHVAEDLDVSAAELRTFSKQRARTAFDEACATNMRENVTFHSKKIEIGLGGDLQGGLIGGFEHLDADRTIEAFSRLFRDALHQIDAEGIERRPDVRNIVAVLQHDHVHACLQILFKIGKSGADYGPAASCVSRGRQATARTPIMVARNLSGIIRMIREFASRHGYLPRQN